MQRQLRDPQIRELISQTRDQHLEELVGVMHTHERRAAERLAELMESEDESIALRAANSVLSTTRSVEASCTLANRLADLERLAQQALLPEADADGEAGGLR